MKRLALILGLSLMLLPAAAVAQSIDFYSTGLGTWSWGGVGTDLTGSSIPPGDVGTVPSVPSGGLNGSIWSWDSGASTSPTAGDASDTLADFSNGTLTITQDGGGYCEYGPCFSGTLISGSLLSPPGSNGFTFEYNIAAGTVDSNLLAVLGLPNPPEGYAGIFTVTLNSDGTWTSADLDLNPVPEPGTLTLLGSGLLGLAGLLRRRLKK